MQHCSFCGCFTANKDNYLTSRGIDGNESYVIDNRFFEYKTWCGRDSCIPHYYHSRFGTRQRSNLASRNKCTLCDIHMDNSANVNVRLLEPGEHRWEDSYNTICVVCAAQLDQSEDMYRCEWCGARAHANFLEVHGHTTLCTICVENELTYCVECDEPIMRDEANYDDWDEGPFCESCYEGSYREYDGAVERGVRTDKKGRTQVTIDEDVEYTPPTTYKGVVNSRHPFPRLAGLELEVIDNNFERRNFKYWHTESDGSLSGNGVEYVSNPCGGSKLTAAIEEIDEYFKDVNAEIDSSCGYHVHLDARDLMYPELCGILAFAKIAEPHINKIVSPGRRGGGWCEPVYQTMEQILAVNSGEEFVKMWNGYDMTSSLDGHVGKSGRRYYGINMHARIYLGTIEFRYHQGTVNKEKIANWIKVCQGIVDAGIALSKEILEFKETNKKGEMYKTIVDDQKMSEIDFIGYISKNHWPLRKWMLNRMIKFAVQDNEEKKADDYRKIRAMRKAQIFNTQNSSVQQYITGVA